MNSYLRTADRVTRLKIVAVSLMAAIAVVAVGISAQITDSNFGISQVHLDRAVVSAGIPTSYTANNVSEIR